MHMRKNKKGLFILYQRSTLASIYLSAIIAVSFVRAKISFPPFTNGQIVIRGN